MPPNTKRPDIFISATSGDLSHIRDIAKKALLSIDCHPVEQSNFPPDYREVESMLREKIANCDAVLHIVGTRYGAEPDPSSLPPDTQRRSYTQLEADIARELDKKLYLFLCPDDFPYGNFEPESPEKQTLQKTYRQSLANDKQLFTPVTDDNDVSLRVRELQTQVESLKSSVTSLEDTLEHSKKSHTRLFLLSALGIALLGTLGWWSFHKTNQKTDALAASVQFDQTKIDAIRINGTTRIQKNYQAEITRIKNDPALANHWKKRKNLADQAADKRDSLLAALDRFLTSVTASYEKGEVLPELEEFLRIAASTEGIEGALAYYKSIRAENDAIVEQLLAKKDDLSAQIRGHLRLDLEAANAAAAIDNWSQAQTLYTSLVQRDPNWIPLLDSYSNFLLTRGTEQDVYGTTSLAESIYNEAITLTQRLVEATPSNTRNLRQLSLCFSRIGDLQQRKGDSALALFSFEKNLVIIEELRLKHPEKSQFKRDLSLVNSRLGDVHHRLGNLEESAKYHRNNLELVKDIFENNPDDIQIMHDLSICYNRTGDNYSRIGHLEEAIAHYREQEILSAKLLETNPNNLSYLYSHSILLQRLGDTYKKTGNSKKSLHFYEKNLETSLTLISKEPKNTSYSFLLSITYQRLGDFYFNNDNFSKSLEFQLLSLTTIEKLTAKDPDHVMYQDVRSFTYHRIGLLRLQQKNIADALKNFDQSIEIRENISRKSPSNIQMQNRLKEAYLELAKINEEHNLVKEALMFYEKYSEKTADLMKKKPDTPRFVRDYFLCEFAVASAYEKLAPTDTKNILSHLSNSLEALQKMQHNETITPSDKPFINTLKSKIKDLTGP